MSANDISYRFVDSLELRNHLVKLHFLRCSSKVRAIVWGTNSGNMNMINR